MKTKTALVSIYPVSKIHFGDHVMSFQYDTPGHLLGTRPKTRVEFIKHMVGQ